MFHVSFYAKSNLFFLIASLILYNYAYSYDFHGYFYPSCCLYTIYLSVCLDANKIASCLELEKRHFGPLEQYSLPLQNDMILFIRI